MWVVIGAGGTAGHVFPGLALAEELSARGHRVTFVGTPAGPEARLVPAAGFDFDAVQARPLVRKVSLDTMRAPLAALRAVRDCRRRIAGADAVVGMGGYASVPSVLAAWREGVPSVLHEQNAIPGLANRALSRVSSAVALVFDEARQFFPRRQRIVVTGNPVRERVLRVLEEREAFAKEARAELELEDGRRTIVIFGGSQGALHLNRAAVGACRLLARRHDLQILLITGAAHLSLVRETISSQGSPLLVRVAGFLDRMELAYAVADLVVARAGAGTIAEVSACGLPSLLIPYPYATRQHQEANARALERARGARVLLDGQLTPDSLSATIVDLIHDEEQLRAMADGARAFGRPDAAGNLAELVVKAAA